MKYAVKDINKLVERIRSCEPPELPEGVREQHYHDPALPGFYIRVLDTGVASWVVQWKRLSRQKKITLGNVLVLDRLGAIKAGRELLAKVTLGLLDPHEARRERMRANKVTFETMIPLFVQDKKRKGQLKPNTEEMWNLYFTDYYFKPLHKLPIDEITSQQLQTQVDTIAGQSGNRTAESCCTAMRVLFKWASRTGKLPLGHHNPMDNIQPPAVNPPRERVLSDDEIRLIWKTCDAWEAKAVYEKQLKETTGKALRTGSPNSADYPRAVKLLFLTGCRRQEIGDLQWSEVDLDNAELRIPGSRRKSRRSQEQAMELCVPLAEWAVEILRGIARRPNGWTSVFGGSRPKKGTGLNLMGAHKHINERITKADDVPPPGWTIHDIRRTFRTKLAQLGVTGDVAEALVGHVGHRTKMDRIYNRHQYWPEKRKALAIWEAHLRAIIDGTAEKIARPRFGERKKGGTA
jgi:integrase